MPFTGYNHLNSVVLFVSIACVAISMYGGGFATVPAYLKDLFGGYNVSAIHGRLLTAWSVAGIVGPLIVNGVLDHYKAAGLNRMDCPPCWPIGNDRCATSAGTMTYVTNTRNCRFWHIL